MNNESMINKTNAKNVEDRQEPLQGIELMRWSIKTIASSPEKIMKAQLGVIGVSCAVILYLTWLMWNSLPDSAGYLITACSAPIILAIYLIAFGVRQKTLFNYRITTSGAEVNHQLYYPEHANVFFKGTALATIMLFLGVAIYTQSLLFLVGPIAIALGAARNLLRWKNETKYEKSRPWNEYNFVSIDTNRLIIITHHKDLTVGFEVRLKDKTHIREYLETLKNLLPPTAQYTEKKWEW